MFIFDTVIYLVIPCIILRFAYVGYIPEIRQIRLLFFPFLFQILIVIIFHYILSHYASHVLTFSITYCWCAKFTHQERNLYKL